MTEQLEEGVRIEPSQKRVRALLGGDVVVDSRSPYLVWEIAYYPAYYLPRADIRAALVPSSVTKDAPGLGRATYYDVVLGEKRVPDGAYAFLESPLNELRDLVHLEWNAMDEWMEEDELVYVHPRSPYTRVDILASSRSVKVVLEGVELAHSNQPRILFETGLPPRYYLPLSHVHAEYLRSSPSSSQCPYKGSASYFSIELNGTTYEDYVWLYRSPLPESAKIAGLLAFYNEKLDIYLDGVLLERPRSPFS